MALTDKDILITPNKGAASDPKIDFIGANASTSGTITMTVLTASGTTLAFTGTVGTLFQISNTGSTTSAVVSIPSTVNATGTTTGALVVSGGVGVGQDLRVGGLIYGTLAGQVSAASQVVITNDITSSTVNFITFVNTSTGNANVRTAASTGMVYVPSTGFFAVGTTNPTERLTVGNGNIQLDNNRSIKFKSVAGVVGNVLRFGSDNHTYLESPASGNIILRTGGTLTDRLQILPSGYVGIGTGANAITTAFPLHVYGDVSGGQIAVETGSGSTTRQAGINYRVDGGDLWQTYLNNADGSNSWRIKYNNTTDYFTIDTAGNAGLGTVTPGDAIISPAPARYFEIFGNGGNPALRLSGNALNQTTIQLVAGVPNVSTSGFTILDETAGANRLSIDSAGRTSINTSTVGNNNFYLDVWGSIGASAGSITIGSGGAILPGSMYSSASYGMLIRANRASPSLAQFLWQTSAGTEIMRIDPNLNLGFGTTAAFEKFVMLGAANTATNPGMSYNMVINASNALTTATLSNVGAGIALGGITTGTTTATFAIISGVKENTTYSDVAGAFIIGTRVSGGNVTEKVRVTSGGLVGIGTITPINRLQVVGGNYTIGISDSAAGNRARLFWQTTSGSVGVGLFNDDNSNLMLGTNGSEKLRIDVNGNIIVSSGYLKIAGGIADNSGGGSALQIFTPGGASTATTVSTVTGAIKIRLPQGYTDTMMRMTVKVYTYNSNSFDITLGGYQNAAGSAWLNTFAYMNTTAMTQLNVRFGYDGTYNCIFIGETNSTWSYPQVFVTDFQAGYNSYAYTSWVNNWQITYYAGAAFANTAAGQYITKTEVAYPTWNKGGTNGLVNVSQLTNDAGYLTSANTVAKYTIGNNGSQPCWIYLGRWNTAQQGYTLHMTITGMQGYNASGSQDQFTEIFFKTSNASSALTGSSGNFYANGQAYRTGGNTNGPQTVRVVQVDNNTYDFYTYWPGLTGQGSMYEVVTSIGTWVNSSTVVTPSGNYLDLTWYTNYTSQSLTNLSQLNNDVPFYKSGDNPTFGTVTANSYAWNGSGATVGVGMLNMTHDSQTLFSGSSVLGDGVNADQLAFRMPDTAEYYNGTSWSSTTVSTFYDAFRGKLSHRFGGSIVLNSTTQQRIRFKWNSWGYNFWNGIILSGNAQGNNMWLTVETSADGTTWTTQVNDVDIGGGWPNYNYVRDISNNSGSSPYLRITIRRNTTGANAANAVYVNNISIIGSYGSYVNLFDWDYSRNVTFPGNVYAPIYYDSNNSSYYINPNSGSSINSLTADGTVTITAPIADSVPSLILAPSSSSGTFQWASKALSSNLGSGQTMIHLLGNATGTNNSGYVGYYYGGSSGSANSFVSLGLYSNDNILRVYGAPYTQSLGSMRAPVFYDSDNTSYYADPAGSTSFWGAGSVGSTAGRSVLRDDSLENWATASDSAGIAVNYYGYNSGSTYFRDFNVYDGKGSLRFKTYGSGNYAYAPGSFRAPIFYDSDNTGYYVDPTAAISANFIGSVNVATNYYAGLRVNASGTSSSGAAFAIQQVTSEGWTGIFVDFEPYTGWGIYHDNPNNYFLITAEDSTNNIGSNTVPSRSSGNRTAFTKFLFSQGDAHGYAGGSWRAPVFYDYNNTAYYGDFASTSQFNVVLANHVYNGVVSSGSLSAGTWYTIAANSGNRASARFQIVDQTSGLHQTVVFYAAHHFGTDGSNAINVISNSYYGGPPIGYIRIKENSTYEGAVVQVYVSNACSGVRVFMYDNEQDGNGWVLVNWVNDNTNPGTVANWAALSERSRVYLAGDRNSTTMSYAGFGLGYDSKIRLFQGNSINSDPMLRIQTDYTYGDFGALNTTWFHHSTGASNGFYWYQFGQNQSSWRAPVFYDSDDTGYYLDPNTTSAQALRIRGGALFGPNPTWGEYLRVGTNGDNGDYAQVMTTNGNLHLDGKRGGYGIYLNWYNGATVYVSNDIQAQIYYDRNDTAYYVDPNGTTNLRGNLYTANGYSHVLYAYNNNGAFAMNNASTYWGLMLNVGANDWRIGYGSQTQYVGWNLRWDNGSTVWANGSMRAPIFYDSDNTGYYLDPNSSSNLYLTYTYLGARYQSTDWADAFRNTPTSGYAWHGDVSSGGPTGTWWFYESMRHSNGSNYWGTQIAWGWEDNANQLYQRNISNNSFSSWRKYWNSGHNLYSSIYYDADDSSYYLDPNSYSRISNMYFTGWARFYGNQGLYNQDYGVHFYGQDSEGWSVTGSGGIVKLLFRSNHQSTVRGYVYGDTSSNFGFLDGNGTWRARIVGNDWIDFSGSSARASIFYDRDDTTYYVNPNGDTYLYGGIWNNGAHGSSRIMNRLLSGNNGAGTGEVRLQMWCSEPGNTWDWAGFGYNVDNSSNTSAPAYYFGRPNASFGQAYMRFGTGGQWYFYTASSGGTRYTHMYLSPGNGVETYGILYNDTSVRAYIYYDRDDTGYYGDFAGTSNINRLTAATNQRFNIQWRGTPRSDITSDTNYWTNTHGWGTSYGTWNNFWYYGAGFYDCWGTGTDHPQGSGYVHTQGLQSGMHYTSSGTYGYGFQMVGAADQGSRWWLRGLWGGSMYSWYEIMLSGRNVGYTLYANIFYDSDNTGYYVDPSSTSRMYKQYLNYRLVFDQNYGHGVFGVYTSTRYQLVWSMGESWALPDDGTTTGNLYGLAWSHPNAGGAASNLASHGLLLIENGSWNFAVGGGSVRSTSDMRSPIFYDSNDTSYRCDPNGNSVLYTLSLGRMGSNLYVRNPADYATSSITSLTEAPISTRWWDPSAGTTAQYFPLTHQTALYNSGYRTHVSTGLFKDASGWGAGWYMCIGGNDSYPTEGFQLRYGGYIRHTYGYVSIEGQTRSPIYYKDSDTSYYVNPNTWSVLWGLGLYYLRNNYDVSVDHPYGMSFSTDVGSSPAYAIFRESGSWSYPYPDLRIGFHTGIKIGAYYGYQGTRIYNNHDMSTQIASFGDGDNNFRSYYNIIAYASDQRLKENIVNIPDALEKVQQLNGVTFDWKVMVKDLGFEPTSWHEAGVLAQQVEAVLPEAVEIAPFDYDWTNPNQSKSGERYLTVKYEKLVPLLIEAIKDQQKIINDQESRLDRLENLIEKLNL